jgi:siroheme synthase
VNNAIGKLEKETAMENAYRVGTAVGAPDLIRLRGAPDTATLYMAAGEAREFSRALLEQGLAPETPVTVVELAPAPPSARNWRLTVGGLPELNKVGATGPALVMLGGAFGKPTETANPSDVDLPAYGDAWFR